MNKYILKRIKLKSNMQIKLKTNKNLLLLKFKSKEKWTEIKYRIRANKHTIGSNINELINFKTSGT